MDGANTLHNFPQSFQRPVDVNPTDDLTAYYHGIIVDLPISE